MNGMNKQRVTLLKDNTKISHFDDVIGNKLSKNNIFYENTMLEYIRSLGSFNTVLDIGANIGNHSLFLGKYVAKKVLSVEPVPNNYELLCKNIKQNNLEHIITPYNYGLARKNGIMYVENIKNNMGACNLVHAGTSNHTVVEVKSASNFAYKFDLVKIDCESMSMEVLYNMLPQIRRNKAHVFIEATMKELYIILNKLNGSIHKVFNSTPTYHVTF